MADSGAGHLWPYRITETTDIETLSIAPQTQSINIPSTITRPSAKLSICAWIESRAIDIRKKERGRERAGLREWEREGARVPAQKSFFRPNTFSDQSEFPVIACALFSARVF